MGSKGFKSQLHGEPECPPLINAVLFGYFALDLLFYFKIITKTPQTHDAT